MSKRIKPFLVKIIKSNGNHYYGYIPAHDIEEAQYLLEFIQIINIRIENWEVLGLSPSKTPTIKLNKEYKFYIERIKQVFGDEYHEYK